MTPGRALLVQRRFVAKLAIVGRAFASGGAGDGGESEPLDDAERLERDLFPREVWLHISSVSISPYKCGYRVCKFVSECVRGDITEIRLEETIIYALSILGTYFAFTGYVSPGGAFFFFVEGGCEGRLVCKLVKFVAAQFSVVRNVCICCIC